jgi:hypothetical protein
MKTLEFTKGMTDDSSWSESKSRLSRRGLRVGKRRWRKGLASVFVIRWPLLAFGAETRMRSNTRGRSMMATSSKVPSIGRIQKRKTHLLQIIIFGLQRAAGLYRWSRS